jgi:hypothetical protein
MKSVKQICEETIGGKMIHGGKLKAAGRKLYHLMISTTLIQQRGDLTKTADALDVTRDGLRYQIRILGIDVEKTVAEGLAAPVDASLLSTLIAVSKKPAVAVHVEPSKIKHG